MRRRPGGRRYGAIYPEDRGHRGCQLARDFGILRGRKAAYGLKQDRLNPIPFDKLEKMAYYRGYQRGYAKVKRMMKSARGE